MTAPASRLTAEAIAGAFHGIELTDKILEEQPYHRHAAYLMAMGASNAEVAEACDVTVHAVRSWLREAWFQQRVSAIMAEHGGRDLTQLFINEAFATAAVMFDLRDAKATPAAVKRGICQDILDRGFGKPKVYIEQTAGNQPVADPVAEVARLEAENKKLLGLN